jgi:hypothetical protein
VQNDYKEVFGSIEENRTVVGSEESSFGSQSLPNMSLETKIQLNQIFGIGSCRIIARKELGSDKRTSCVIGSDSVNVINPLPGYD